MTRVHDLRTPALLVEADALEHNLRTRAEARHGASPRPHVKAHKCTALARRAATEIQAGSYALMDTAYDRLGLPFRQALSVLSTVVSVSPRYAVADCGLKALGMDHGNPTIDGAKVWFCSDEHLTFAAERRVRVGDRIRVRPAHVDPTVAYHEQLHVISGEEVLESWDVDLRGW